MHVCFRRLLLLNVFTAFFFFILALKKIVKCQHEKDITKTRNVTTLTFLGYFPSFGGR